MHSSLFGGGGGGSSVPAWQSVPLQELYGRAEQASYETGGEDYAGQYLDPSFSAFQDLSSGGNIIPGLESGLVNFGQEQNAYLGGAIDAGINDINRNFEQNIMPTINQGAALSGTSGGSRQGIAQGIAAGEANRNVSDFVNEMYSDNYATTMENRLGASGQLIDMEGQRNQAQGAAMSYAPGLSQMGFEQQYGNLQNLAQLLGNPITLQNQSAAPGIMAPLQFGYSGGGG